MTHKIKTYQDLVRQEEQLEELLKAQKELLFQDLRELREGLKPVTGALSIFSKVTTREKGSFILNQGANSLIDLIVKKVILAKAGWLTRLTVPFFIKNISSHVIADKKEKWMDKLFSWIRHKNGNGKVAPVTADEKETDASDQ